MIGPGCPEFSGFSGHRDHLRAQPAPSPTGLTKFFAETAKRGHSGGANGERSGDGYHWLYVLSGRLRVVLGAQNLVLTSGEVAEFATHLPHWFGNADARPVEFLSILGPQGERFHVKARYRPADSR